MLRRRRIQTNSINGSVAPLRSSIADAAWALEERLVWGGADALRGIAATAKRPFEQLSWATERLLVWPLQERTDHWGTPLRAAATGGVVLLAAAAVTAGALLAKGSGNEAAEPVVKQTAVLTPSPAPTAAPTPTTPVLKGAAPDFTPEAGEGVPKAADAIPKSTADATSATAAAAPPSTGAGAAGAPATAGPAAVKVVRQFAAAFVLYETGRGEEDALRTAFAETATPKVIHSLLQRPPRLPADVKVPQAKVLNVVAGPQSGTTFTFSISLLRVGVTSELRVDVERNPKSGKWQVTDVLG